MWIFVHSFEQKSNVKDRSTVATTVGEKLQRNRRKEEGTIPHFWVNCLLTFSSALRSHLSNAMMPTMPYFLFFFAIWVYESCKNGLWSSKCDRTYSAKNQAHQNDSTRERETCIWKRIKHIHTDTKAKLQTLYGIEKCDDVYVCMYASVCMV